VEIGSLLCQGKDFIKNPAYAGPEYHVRFKNNAYFIENEEGERIETLRDFL
jgi:hypothetical protein